MASLSARRAPRTAPPRALLRGMLPSWLPWSLCALLLVFHVASSPRRPGSSLTVGLPYAQRAHEQSFAGSGAGGAASGTSGGGSGSGSSGRRMALVSRQLHAPHQLQLRPEVDESRFPPQDWWDLQPGRQEIIPYPSCAQLECLYCPTCTAADPACCAYWLRGLLEFASFFLTKHGIQWAVTYGTLLGAVRDQAIIPWTYDIDIGIPLGDWNDFIRRDSLELRRDAWRYGFMVLPGGLRGASRICYHPGHPRLATPPGTPPRERSGWEAQHLPGVYADLYAMVATPDKGPHAYQSMLSDDAVPQLNCTFRSMYQVEDLQVPGVDDSEEHLAAWYGGDWRKPRVTGLGGRPGLQA